MRWSEKETYQFVTIFLRHECLWNYENPSYKIKAKRQKAYHEIIADFRTATGIQLNESELKVKVKNLRSTYTQELKKVKVRSDTFYTPAMRWFAEWHKCFKELKRFGIKSNDSLDTQELGDDPCQKIWMSTDNENDNDNAGDADADPFVSESVDQYIILKSEPRESALHNQHHHDNLYDDKKNNLNHRCSSTECSDRTCRDSTDFSSEESGPREDEFDIYGKYIAAQLRKMDLQKALRVQLEIQGLVSEARISGLSGN